MSYDDTPNTQSDFATFIFKSITKLQALLIGLDFGLLLVQAYPKY